MNQLTELTTVVAGGGKKLSAQVIESLKAQFVGDEVQERLKSQERVTEEKSVFFTCPECGQKCYESNGQDERHHLLTCTACEYSTEIEINDRPIIIKSKRAGNRAIIVPS